MFGHRRAGRPRRLASAQTNLSLALLAAGKPDETCAAVLAATISGRVMPSNWWRATEVLTRVEATGIREVRDRRTADPDRAGAQPHRRRHPHVLCGGGQRSGARTQLWADNRWPKFGIAPSVGSESIRI